jgi:2'-5' RNA ligase
MLPGDRLICGFVDEFKIGDTFSKWPLHITIVPWFRLDDPSEQIARGLQQALTLVKPFTVIVGETAVFGPRKRQAHVLEPSRLTEVEKRVRKYFHQKRAWLVDETTKRKYDFRPHITFQGDEHLQKGDRVQIDRLYAVQQQGGHKLVAGIIELDHEAKT